MVNMNVKMKDVMDNLSSRISGHDLFDFDVSHIDRMRTEIYDVLSHITGIYRNHRLLSHPNADGTALDLASESEEDDDENDVTIFSRESQSMDESGNDKDLYSDDDASFLSQSHADDEEDDVLSADTTGKSGLDLLNNSFASFIMERRSILLFSGDLGQFHISSDDNYNYIDLDCNFACEDEEQASSDLNMFIQMGDIIEYRSSKHDVPKKGEIISIGALSSDKIIQVSDGTWLFKKVHDVKRIEIMRADEDKRLVNPSPKWKGLNKVVVIPPYESVEEDEDEDGSVVSTNSTQANEYDIDEPQANQEDIGRSEKVPMNTSRSDKSKRQRTSCGETGQTYYSKTRRVRKEEADLDERRATEEFIRWAAPGSVYVYDYDKAKSTINRLYLLSLRYGIVDKFYEKEPHEAPTHTEFKKRVKSLRNLVNYRIKTSAIKLTIKTDIVFMDNPGYGQHGQSRETKRSRQTVEEIYKFEYRMRTLQLQTCSVCRENKLEFSSKDKRHDMHESGKVVCEMCRTKKHEESDYFLKNNLHPVWYERDSDGCIKTDEDGKPVVRHDIPHELKCLTMAEKLLIRRCSPLIPSHHIKNGIYGLNGHCVCFPQDIDAMCSDLPQTQSNMVIFVRHISNRDSGVSHSRHFKVNKKKVLAALRWLKLHHRGYHDITITESNLDWIKEGSVYDVANNYTLRTKPSRRDAVTDSRETVSGNQCGTGVDDDELEMETVHPNYKDNVPNESQSEIIKEFEAIAEETNQKDKILDFPPIDHNQPKK